MGRPQRVRGSPSFSGVKASSYPGGSGWTEPCTQRGAPPRPLRLGPSSARQASDTVAKTKQETLQLQEKRSRTSNKLKKEERGAERSGVGPLPSLPKVFLPELSGEPGPHACLSVCGTLLPRRPKEVHWSSRFSWISLDKEQGGRVGRGLEEPRDSSSLSCCPPMWDGLGCGVASVALQGPHPGPEVGVHSQQAHEGQGVEHHTEADVQVGEVPF